MLKRVRSIISISSSVLPARETSIGEMSSTAVSHAADERLSLAGGWDEFVESAVGGSLVQSSAWGEVKRQLGFETRVVIQRAGNAIVGGALLVIRRLGPFRAVGYVACGPLFRRLDPKSAVEVLDEIESVVRSLGVMLLVVQPPEGGEMIEALLDTRGYTPAPLAVHPTATVRLDLRQDLDQLIAGMGRTRRRYIRGFAGEHPLRMRFGGEADVELFHRLHVATAERQGFAPRSLRYLQAHWALLAPRGWLRLVLAELDGEAVGGSWLTLFGDTVTFRLAAWNGRARELHPNEACHWWAMRWAKANSFSYYDMGGIDRSFAETIVGGAALPESWASSPCRFKQQFGGQIVLLPMPRLKARNQLMRSALTVMQRNSLITRLANRLRG